MNIPKKTQNIILIVVIVISIIQMIILGVNYAQNRAASNNAAEKTSIIEMKEKEDNVLISVNTETIQDGLQDMGVLITQEYYFTQVEKYTKEKTILFVLPSSSEMMYSYDGSVLAGIDFEEILIEKDDTNKTITVRIPHSSIQVVTIDKDSFEVYSENDSLWNPIELEDYNVSLAEFEEAAKDKAIENGILERSDEQAVNLIENFIDSFPSVAEYDVSYEWREDDES